MNIDKARKLSIGSIVRVSAGQPGHGEAFTGKVTWILNDAKAEVAFNGNEYITVEVTNGQHKCMVPSTRLS